MRVNETTERSAAERRHLTGGLLIGLAVVLAITGYTMWGRATTAADNDSFSAEFRCALDGDRFCDSDVEPAREVPYALFAGAALAFLGGVIVASSARAGGEAVAAPARSSLVAELDGVDALLAEGRLTVDEHAAARRRILGTAE
jgi:hypothetical protein